MVETILRCTFLFVENEGGQLTYFLGGYVCWITQNCDP